jgi:hypothetical protein
MWHSYGMLRDRNTSAIAGEVGTALTRFMVYKAPSTIIRLDGMFAKFKRPSRKLTTSGKVSIVPLVIDQDIIRG